MPIGSSPDLAHSCSEIIDLTYSSRAELLDRPLDNPDGEWFTDGSSFVQSGHLLEAV